MTRARLAPFALVLACGGGGGGGGWGEIGTAKAIDAFACSATLPGAPLPPVVDDDDWPDPRTTENEQLIEYRAAIALYLARHTAEAVAAFAEIARRPWHVKFDETFLWMLKLVDEDPTLIHAMRYYDLRHVQVLDNEHQRDVYWKASFLIGRERFERGERDAAILALGRVAPESPYHPLAQACLRRLR